jgi:hypothetical protein
VRVWLLFVLGLYMCHVAPAAAQAPGHAAGPETFSAKARAENAAGAAVEAPIVIHIERYTPDFDRGVVEEALRVNGYPGFLPAVRKAPDVGYVEVNGRKVTIRYARQVTTVAGRTIVVVTDHVVAFIGGGGGAKSPAGYEVAIVQLKVDAHGTGSGTMAAAARVKPGGETGVQVDDYAEAPIALTMVTRK